MTIPVIAPPDKVSLSKDNALVGVAVGSVDGVADGIVDGVADGMVDGVSVGTLDGESVGTLDGAAVDGVAVGNTVGADDAELPEK